MSNLSRLKRAIKERPNAAQRCIVRVPNEKGQPEAMTVDQAIERHLLPSRGLADLLAQFSALSDDPISSDAIDSNRKAMQSLPLSYSPEQVAEQIGSEGISSFVSIPNPALN